MVPKVTLVNVTAVLEKFVTRTLCVTDDPTLVSGKERLVGDTVTLPSVALPSSRTVWVLLG